MTFANLTLRRARLPGISSFSVELGFKNFLGCVSKPLIITYTQVKASLRVKFGLEFIQLGIKCLGENVKVLLRLSLGLFVGCLDASASCRNCLAHDFRLWEVSSELMMEI